MPPTSGIIPPEEYVPPGRYAPAVPPIGKTKAVRKVLNATSAEVAALDPAMMRQLLPVLHDARRELRAGLTRWLRDVPDGAERYTAQAHRNALLQMEQAIKTIEKIEPTLAGVLSGGAEAAGFLAVDHLQFQLARFGAAFGESIRPVNINAAAIVADGQRMLVPRYRTSAKRYVGAVRDDLKHQLALGLAKGENFTQVTNRLRRLGGPRGLVALRGVRGEPGAVVEEISEGLFRRYRHWAERIVRTESIQAYNIQHTEAIDELNQDLFVGEAKFMRRWDASLDKRLCPTCDALDTKVAPVDGPFEGGYDHPPAHPNCRCTVTTWSPEWNSGERKNTKPVPPKAEPKTQAKRKKRAAPKKRKAEKVATATRPPPRRRPARQVAPAYQQTENDRKATRAIGQGKWTAGRRAIEAELSSQGLHGRVESTKKIRPQDIGANGLHRANGEIIIHPGVAVPAKAFSRAWSADPKGVADRIAEAGQLSPTIGRLGRKADVLYPKIQKARGRLEALRPGEPLNPLDIIMGKEPAVGSGPEWDRAAASLARLEAKEAELQRRRRAVKERAQPGMAHLRGADALRTVYHETIHGYGPGGPQTWRESGIVVEEITTETVARAQIMRRFPMPADFYDKGGSYGEWIDPFTAKVGEVYGVDKSTAKSMVREASTAYKSSSKRARYTGDVVDQFTGEFPGTKSDRGRLASTIHRLAGEDVVGYQRGTRRIESGIERRRRK